MLNMEEGIECDSFIFLNNFDSANLAKVEKVDITENKKIENGKHENNKNRKNVPPPPSPNYEFNIWTKYDCHGTEYQNNNKTWFHFGIKSPKPNVLVKLNLVNLNKQVKMFSQGMSPVCKVIPGQPQWERIKDKPTFIADDKNNEFVLSFTYNTSENLNAITYFAFTYPFSYTELQNHLKKIDTKMENMKQSANYIDDIYYCRECAILSLEGRRLDVLTISSYYNILSEKETRLPNLFPNKNEDRPLKFRDKKIIFISARVHPGETPSSFVLNGFLNFILNRDDQIAIVLRRMYVFKLIPMLNPDGVAQGYYRMDTRGVNLNRMYLNPSIEEHPTIYATKALLKYYHQSYSMSINCVPNMTKIDVGTQSFMSKSEPICAYSYSANEPKPISNETSKLLQRVTMMSLEEKSKCMEQGSQIRKSLLQASKTSQMKNEENLESETKNIELADDYDSITSFSISSSNQNSLNQENSGIFLYMDFHGHASKKGIFIYGNHFEDPEDSSACMLFPKLMSINNPNFHFTSCNFAEKNMYLIDKRDGMSREGSGRVAVFKLFGIIHSYTLECNYNTGRLVNTVPARVKERLRKIHGQLYVPPKYSPSVFEEVGAAIGPSILDMTDSNPNSRVPNSQYRSLKGLISYLKLISANHFQTPTNKGSQKSKGLNQLHKLQVSQLYKLDGSNVTFGSTSSFAENSNINLVPDSHFSELSTQNLANANESTKKGRAVKRIHRKVSKNNQKVANQDDGKTANKSKAPKIVRLKKPTDSKINFSKRKMVYYKLKAAERKLKLKVSKKSQESLNENQEKKNNVKKQVSVVHKKIAQIIPKVTRRQSQVKLSEPSKKTVNHKK